MADRRRRGGGRSPETWGGSWEGKILEIIYGYYKKALDALPLEEMPSLAPRLLAAGVCFGFADPVTNIIANTLSFRESEPDLSFREPEPDDAKRRKHKRKRKTNVREGVFSKIVAGDSPSPPELRTVAERSLQGLVSFLTSYFRYLPTWDALRYLSQARADLLVAVHLIEEDRCYHRKHKFRVCLPAVKSALKCAAWSAGQTNFAVFLDGCFAVVSHVSSFTNTLSAEGCCCFTVDDISWLSELLATPLKLREYDEPMKLVRNRFNDPVIDVENVPGHLTEALRGTLMDRVHGHYLKAMSRFPMKDLQSHHHRGLLKAGYCFGPLDLVSNIIVNTLWYGISFSPTEEFEVDMISTVRHVEARSVNGLIAFVLAWFPEISEHQAMMYLLNSNLDVCNTVQMTKPKVCDDSGYMAAAKAASHPNPEAYSEFVSRYFSGVRSGVISLLQGSQVISSAKISEVCTLLAIPTVELSEPVVELTEDAMKRITQYKEEFFSQQSLVRRKVETALRNYEQSKVILGSYYDLGIICGLNDCVGEVTGVFDTKYKYTHMSDAVTVNIMEFVLYIRLRIVGRGQMAFRKLHMGNNISQMNKLLAVRGG
ncbi:hypothetical protein HU200_000199 [Digitaria exilis]|uniref:PIR2-like helical domain-containing protein n=1 Tax=Digitaria exilis TaxID=1010633 RepID=A0A835KXD0_9POAL|nr:hypothetical protein HU200_000199 [Digitaria exilis]